MDGMWGKNINVYASLHPAVAFQDDLNQVSGKENLEKQNNRFICSILSENHQDSKICKVKSRKIRKGRQRKAWHLVQLHPEGKAKCQKL